MNFWCITNANVLLLVIGKTQICQFVKKKAGVRRILFMVKNSFISVISISQEEKKGSVEFQIFSFTNKIRRLTSHLELHRKDYLSQRGLRQILGKRQRLLSYLSKKNRVRYKELISKFAIREIKTHPN
uniref:Small ribosomal subunit protein uS15c n=1 Tax=Epimedium acuminatum TaxID=253612 RepID=A0A7M3UMS5_9MAGN|nr:ribosomal protein S15 [Epimedium baojingense]QOI13290.1 ribosomal protein S15 [Epimedium acuminatum]UOA65345.1 ribosomal protein S15 [Epimedium baojingense]